MSNLSHAASPASQSRAVPPPAKVTVQPVGFNVVKREKQPENLPGSGHIGMNSSHPGFWGFIRNKSVVLNQHKRGIIIVSNVNFLWFPSTDIFVATRNGDFLADHNVMTCLGSDLTFYFEHKTGAGPSCWNMDLN